MHPRQIAVALARSAVRVVARSILPPIGRSPTGRGPDRGAPCRPINIISMVTIITIIAVAVVINININIIINIIIIVVTIM